MCQMWTPYDFLVKITLFLCGQNMVSYGHHVVTMLTQCDYHMVFRWTPYGSYVDNMWFPCGHHVVFKFISIHICKDD